MTSPHPVPPHDRSRDEHDDGHQPEHRPESLERRVARRPAAREPPPEPPEVQVRQPVQHSVAEAAAGIGLVERLEIVDRVGERLRKREEALARKRAREAQEKKE